MNKAFTVTCLAAVALAASSKMEDALANKTVTVGSPVNNKIINNGDAKKMKKEDSKKSAKKAKCEKDGVSDESDDEPINIRQIRTLAQTTAKVEHKIEVVPYNGTELA